MVHLKRVFRTRGRRIGLITVRERGLDLDVWEGGSCPCWSTGVVGAALGAPEPGKIPGLPEVRRWLLVLPTYLCTTRCIQLPSSRPEEIAAMLEFEAPQLVPCSTQAWTWDFCVTGRGQDGASQVLVVLSPLSVVESALEQARAVGIEPRLVTVSAALHAMRLAQGGEIDEAGVCGYAWWDHGGMDFFAMDARKLVFVRGIRISAQNSHALDWAEAETARSVSLFREGTNCPVPLPVRVGGAHLEVAGLVERLARHASIRVDQTALATSYDRRFTRDPMAAAGAPRAWGDGHAHAACVNLLPQHRKEKDGRARRRRELLGMGLRACLVTLLALLCVRMSAWRAERLLDRYQQRLAQIAPVAQQLQFLQSQLDMIQTQVQGSVSMLDILAQLHEVLPPDVTIHYLSIDQNQQVVIRAQAKWLSQAFDCIDPLEQSQYLANVRQSYAHLRELEGQVLIDFELQADLEKHSLKEAEP